MYGGLSNPCSFELWRCALGAAATCQWPRFPGCSMSGRRAFQEHVKAAGLFEIISSAWTLKTDECALMWQQHVSRGKGVVGGMTLARCLSNDGGECRRQRLSARPDRRASSAASFRFATGAQAGLSEPPASPHAVSAVRSRAAFRTVCAPFFASASLRTARDFFSKLVSDPSMLPAITDSRILRPFAPA